MRAESRRGVKWLSILDFRLDGGVSASNWHSQLQVAMDGSLSFSDIGRNTPCILAGRCCSAGILGILHLG